MIPLASEWQTLPIKDLPIEVIDGDRSGKYPKRSEFRSSGVPFLNSSIIIDNRLFIEDGNFISQEKFDQIKKGRVQRGDIVVTTRGNGVGKTAFFDGRFPTALINAQMLILRAKADRLDPRFLYFQIISPAFQRRIWSYASGSAQPQIPIRDFRDIHLDIPGLGTQRKISDILSAYDELIENNQRRIKILEEMARSLYREWFVNFRFPGHEKVPLVDSPLGLIPKGWEVKKLSSFVDTQYGYTESTNQEPIGPKYLRGMDINKTSYIDWSQVPYCPITRDDQVAYRLNKGDVVVIRMADPGKVGIVEENVEAVFASYLIRVAPKGERLRPYFLFHLLDSSAYQSYISGASTGTTRKSASAGVITDFLFALPPKTLIAAFEERAASFRGLLTTFLKQIANLHRTRDLLLQRLLRGDVRLRVEEGANG